MIESIFGLGTFATTGSQFVGIVLGDHVFDLDALRHRLESSSASRATSMLDLLADWDRQFDSARTLVERLEKEGRSSDRFAGAAYALGSLEALPPVLRPGKTFNAAANYKDHALGMRKAFSGGAVDMSKDYGFDKTKGRPYFFLRASSTISGANSPIELPAWTERTDWEAELGVVIGLRGKHIPAEKALDHVAGFTITNDVSCRDLTWREDRPALRSDWLSGKSFDGFAPTGPFFVPRQFIPDYKALQIKLSVNGVLKQDGLAGDMIFTVEDQIEYASRMLAIEPGDLFATGTPAGTGQERKEFLKVGDIVETEIAPLGRQRNVVVASDNSYVRG